MQISTSVGVVQDILISLSFQKNTKLIGPFQAARSARRDMRQAWENEGVSERVRPMGLSARSLIDESALIAPVSAKRGRPPPVFQGGHQATCPCLPGYSARLRGHAGNRTHTRPQSATCAERAVRLLSLRGCSSSRVPPPGVNSFAPAALFLGIGLFAPPSARTATWQS